MTIQEKKKTLRQDIQQRISCLDAAYRRNADTAIIKALLQLPEYRQAHTLFCYIGTDREINTRPLIEQAWQDGKAVGVPLCLSPGIMETHRITSWNDVHPGFYHIEEPQADTPVLQPRDIDLGIIPCVTGSCQGLRLGYGGGYYDRYLLQGTFATIMLCRSRIMTDDVPTEPHDIPIDIIISEKNVWRKETAL
jgi:5-formyltetrahydrofolate cyclo-ligase